MKALLSIRVQKLFMLAVILKVVSAFSGWHLQLQWSLGLALPLVVMAAYIAVGLNRQDRDVSDEKFADSCYYLGFIFTITSIIFGLFDLPHIGERIQDIAVRFGAAMVSTVFGLAVRVYLVSFRPDFNDALKSTEDALLEAAEKFREQLVMAYEKLQDFQSQVTSSTQTTVETVKLQVEKLTQDHSARMERIFLDLNERNQQAVTKALSEVSTASSRMAQSVDGYTENMKTSLQSLGDKVDAFGDSVMQRLKTTTFPDDYFASRLEMPLEQLNAAASNMSEQVQTAASGASEAANVLTAAIRKLKTKATQAEESLDTVVRLTTAQHSLFDASAAQLEQLNKLGELLGDVQQALQATTNAATVNASSNLEVLGGVTAVVSAVETSQNAVLEAMGQVSLRLDAERDAASSLGIQLQSSEAATKELAQELRGNSVMARQLTASLEAEAGTRHQLAAVLQEQGESISNALSRLESKVSAVPPTGNALVPPISAADTSSKHLDVASAALALSMRSVPDTPFQPGSPTPSVSYLLDPKSGTLGGGTAGSTQD